MKPDITSVISRFRYRKLSGLAKLQKCRHKVVGYFCIYVPPELIEAYGFIPVRLTGAGDGAAENAGEKLAHNEACSFCKECLGLKQLKRLPHNAADYVIIPSTCDQMKRQGEKWHHDFNIPTYHLFVPATWQDPACQNIYWQELKWLAAELSDLASHKPDAGSLKGIIQQYNEARKRLARLSGYLTYPDYFDLGHLFLISPVADFLDYLDEIEKLAVSPLSLSGKKRLMLVGSPVGAGDTFIRRALAKYPDMDIVYDATCTGRRGFDINITVGGDPLADIATAYFTRPPCIRRRPNDQFYEYIQTLISKYQIDGIIYKTLKFCDLWKYEFQRFKGWVNRPVLSIETSVAQDAQADKRLSAFIEIIRNG